MWSGSLALIVDISSSCKLLSHSCLKFKGRALIRPNSRVIVSSSPVAVAVTPGGGRAHTVSGSGFQGLCYVHRFSLLFLISFQVLCPLGEKSVEGFIYKSADLFSQEKKSPSKCLKEGKGPCPSFPVGSKPRYSRSHSRHKVSIQK